MSLSERGQAAAVPSPSGLIWEVISNLWDPETNPDGFVSLGVAENALMHETLNKHLHDKIRLPTHSLTYGDGSYGSKRLCAAIARFLNRQLHPVVPIEASHICVTNGCSTAIEHCSWAFTNPGEGFLLGQPYYGAFVGDLSTRFGGEVVKVPFHGVDPLGLDAVVKYEEALLKFQEAKGKKVKGLMLCNPHNPLGRCYSREVIVELMKLCQKYSMHFVSDEIYALSIWQNHEDTEPAPVPFVSASSVDTTDIIDPNSVHILWGMSKDFGANGLRIGAVITQSNTALQRAIRTVSFYSYISSASDHIASNILEDDAWVDAYIRVNRQKLSDNYSVAVAILRAHDIKYMPGANAAFFLWVDLGRSYRNKHASNAHLQQADIDITEVVMQRLLSKKIFLASGALFGSEEPGWFRIVFSQPRELLEEGMRRIVDAIESDDGLESELDALHV